MIARSFPAATFDDIAWRASNSPYRVRAFEYSGDSGELMYLGRRASSTRPPNAIARPCASRIGNITRARNMSYAPSPSFLTSPTFTPASRSPRRSSAFASDAGRLGANPIMNALARRRPGLVVLRQRHGVLARERTHRFGKRQPLDAHYEVENAAARAASKAMKESALGIHRERRRLLVVEWAQPDEV